MFSLPKEFPLLCRQHSACCLSEGRRCVFLTDMFKDTVKLILSFKEGESYFWKFYMPRKKYNKKRKRKCYVPNPGMSVLSPATPGKSSMDGEGGSPTPPVGKAESWEGRQDKAVRADTSVHTRASTFFLIQRSLERRKMNLGPLFFNLWYSW